MSECIIFKGCDLEIEITSYYAGANAITDRLPEDCSPAESAEVDWTYVEDIDPLLELLLDLYEEEIREVILQHMADNPPEPLEPDTDGSDDFMEQY